MLESSLREGVKAVLFFLNVREMEIEVCCAVEMSGHYWPLKGRAVNQFNGCKMARSPLPQHH